ncbi:MAG: hypothetical protein LBS54_05730 [Dysgonamonadaceae bacterium]|nr:hypothetical protein [Dysgonamonadaceae bacterium]
MAAKLQKNPYPSIKKERKYNETACPALQNRTPLTIIAAYLFLMVIQYACILISPTPASGHLRRLRRDTSDACVGTLPTLASGYI